MNIWGGFIPIIIYASSVGGNVIPDGAILTEASQPILAEDGRFLIIE